MPSAHSNLLIFGFLQSFMATGILYGWPGLVLILKADGMYAPLCEGSEGFNHTESERGCPAQTAALTDLFNVAQATLTGAMVVNGNLLDRFGPRCVSCLGSSLCALGALLFALLPPPQPDDAFDMAYVSLCIMAVGGSGVHLSWFHFPTSFRRIDRQYPPSSSLALSGAARCFRCISCLQMRCPATALVESRSSSCTDCWLRALCHQQSGCGQTHRSPSVTA